MKLADLFESVITNEYYVIIFDLCSSSVILEKLQEQNQLRIWRKFWEDVFQYLNKISLGGARCIVYKFVGDGFILLYRPGQTKNLLEFCENIKNFVNEKINTIVEGNFDEFTGRTGITIGIDKGKVTRMRLYGNVEYMGRAINVAARLQSLLKLPEHSNKMLISMEVKNEIDQQLCDRACKPVEQKLHNLFGDENVTCFEIEMN